MRILILGILALLVAGCSSFSEYSPKGPEFYLKEGEEYLERGMYRDAIASWEKVRESYYSPELNALADLKIAEAHFLGKEYVEAAIAYESFLKEHPRHERAPQILFQLGLSNYYQILEVDRDQTATRNALVTFENLVTHYPAAPQVEEARRLIQDCRDKLAAHELYVGRFYLKYKQPKAAIRRLENIITTYPRFSDRGEVYLLLGQSYLEVGRRQSAEDIFASLNREFPDSPLLEQARKALAEKR